MSQGVAPLFSFTSFLISSSLILFLSFFLSFYIYCCMCVCGYSLLLQRRPLLIIHAHDVFSNFLLWGRPSCSRQRRNVRVLYLFFSSSSSRQTRVISKPPHQSSRLNYEMSFDDRQRERNLNARVYIPASSVDAIIINRNKKNWRRKTISQLLR